jgi:hypothetical protein
VVRELDGAQDLADAFADADAHRRDRCQDRLLQEDGCFFPCAFWPRALARTLTECSMALET